MLPIVADAAPFQSAYSDAARFQGIPEFDLWRKDTLYPTLGAQLQDALRQCFHSPELQGKVYHLVLAFDANGRPLRLLIRAHESGLDCFAQAVSAARVPDAPAPNFLERFDLTITP